MFHPARFTHRRSLLFAVAVAATTLPATLAAQQESPTNLQVLPKDMTRREVTQVMREFTQGLGLRCSSCHVGEEGQPMSTYDFASDDKAMKLKAREMLRMVGAINGTYLADLPQRREPNVRVTCATCHRGVTRPEAIESIVQGSVESDGVDAALAKYRELRERYYGSAAYDFTEFPMLAAAQGLGGADAEAARRVLELNLEFNPNSGRTVFALAELQADAGNKEEAIALYKRGMEIMPDNAQAQRRLKELTGGD